MREKQGREAGHGPCFRLVPALAGRLGFTVLGTLPGPTEPSFHLEFLARVWWPLKMGFMDLEDCF